MNRFERSVSRRSTVWGWTLLLAITATGWARAQDFTVPPTLLIPNYDRVYPGLIESLEGGAVVARARNAPALFYNPAGIALSDRTVLNANAQGYQLTTLSGSGFEQTSGGAFETLPSFVGLVLGREVIDWESVRIGFAVVHPVHSNLTVIASTTPEVGQRASYSVRSPSHSDPHLLGGMGAGAQPPPRWLDRVSVHKSSEHRSAVRGDSPRDHQPVHAADPRRDRLGAPPPWDVRGAVGRAELVQAGCAGANSRVEDQASGSTQYEALTVSAAGTRQVFFQDPDIDFQYKLPLEAILGVAFEFGPFGIEVDLKWHDGTDAYPLYASTKTLRVVDTSTGTPVISEAAYPGVSYRARMLWNGSIEAHVALSETFVISAGSYLDYSPVDPAVGKAFRKVDVVGFRAGVSFRIDKLSASVGGGWEHGTGNDNLFPTSGLPIPEQPSSELTINTFTLLFSISFKF